jgi:hypothetical protein
MNDQQILALALRLSPWAGLVVSLLYIAINKVGPVWLADWRASRQQARATREAERKTREDDEQAERKVTATLYDRLVSQTAEMIKFIATSTDAIHEITRALDSNTQQLYRITHSVERGPNCPLPACPFMGKKDRP